MRRIAVVGASCSGKTTFADRLSQILQIPHIELDVLHWGPNWTIRDDFEINVLQMIEQECWIVDGNYKNVREAIFSKADSILWLNYSFHKVFARALKRTVPRVFSGETIYADNRETFFTTFFSSDSILWWVIKTHKQRKVEYSSLFSSQKFSHLNVFDFKHPKQCSNYLKTIKELHEI